MGENMHGSKTRIGKSVSSELACAKDPVSQAFRVCRYA